MTDFVNVKNILAAVGYSGLGLLILALSFWVFDLITPGNLWKEIVEEHNQALAITTAAMILGMSWIIASAIHG